VVVVVVVLVVVRRGMFYIADSHLCTPSELFPDTEGCSRSVVLASCASIIIIISGLHHYECVTPQQPPE